MDKTPGENRAVLSTQAFIVTYNFHPTMTNPTSRPCPQCSTPNDADSQFCDQCGAPLTQRYAPPDEVRVAPVTVSPVDSGGIKIVPPPPAAGRFFSRAHQETRPPIFKVFLKWVAFALIVALGTIALLAYQVDREQDWARREINKKIALSGTNVSCNEVHLSYDEENNGSCKLSTQRTLYFSQTTNRDGQTEVRLKNPEVLKAPPLGTSGDSMSR